MTSNYHYRAQAMRKLVELYGHPTHLQRLLMPMQLILIFDGPNRAYIDLEDLPREWDQLMMWQRGFKWGWKNKGLPQLGRRIWCLRDWGIPPAVAARLVTEHYEREG